MRERPGERVLLIATRSRHKLAELRDLLDLPGTTLVSPADVGIEVEPAEDALTFRGNALRKARFYALTRAGRKQLVTETSQWRRLAAAIARILGPEDA